MKADLAGQIHELMEHGMRPVTVTDIKSRAPVRMTPVPRHIHLKLITSRVWVPVKNLCGPVYKRSKSANGKTTIHTFAGEKCPNIGSLNDPTYRLLQSLPTNPAYPARDDLPGRTRPRSRS